MLRRLSVLTTTWVVLLALLSSAAAEAQEDGTDETPSELAYYGDAELIETLRTYDLLDEWLATSPVSPQASLLLVTGNAGYQAQRQQFLESIEAWAARTELVRAEVARVEAAQANADRLRSVVTQVRDALVLDDRLATDSNTLREFEDALMQLAAVQIPEQLVGESEDPLVLAEVKLGAVWALVETELHAINGVEPAFTSSGIDAFTGYEYVWTELNSIDQLIARGRELIRPAREESERLVSSAVAQIPSLHRARMVASTDVDGLSVVTVDAYVRAATRSSCSVDWALLAGIGKIESDHGRIGGASVSSSGKVSTTILGPLLDGGASERGADGNGSSNDADSVEADSVEADWAIVVQALEAARRSAQEAVDSAWWGVPQPADDGNGFAVVIDSDGGRLDGNDQWDRAIGPMQFLPETWSRWAIDGNGDGVADPHNLYDAAATAGRFLCELRATRGPSPSTFVLGYNSSTSYVRNVLSAAQALRSTSLPAV